MYIWTLDTLVMIVAWDLEKSTTSGNMIKPVKVERHLSERWKNQVRTHQERNRNFPTRNWLPLRYLHSFAFCFPPSHSLLHNSTQLYAYNLVISNYSHYNLDILHFKQHRDPTTFIEYHRNPITTRVCANCIYSYFSWPTSLRKCMRSMMGRSWVMMKQRYAG